MAEITRERLAYLRHQSRPLEEGEPGYVTVRLYAHELRALLDAADERDRLRTENDVLRGLVQHNPAWKCTYGLAIDCMAECPHGFPGCSCADDLMCGEDAAWKALAEERNRLRAAKDAADAL